jgi:hypothetical protein
MCKPLFHTDGASALKMVEDGAAFILTESPLEIALKFSPGRKRNQIDIETLRPDRSLIIGPCVIEGATDALTGCVAIVNSYFGNASWNEQVASAVRETAAREKAGALTPSGGYKP